MTCGPPVAVVALPFLRFVCLWMMGDVVNRLTLVALVPLGIAVVGWVGARQGRPGLTWYSAIGLTMLVVILTRVSYGMLPFVYVPGAAAMFMAAGLVRERPSGNRASFGDITTS